jgi:L-malate glycosyltransferase
MPNSSQVRGPSSLTVFIAHPSSLLTDHRPHGDGLIAWSYITGIAARGHQVHVAVQEADVRHELPENVHAYVLGTKGGNAALGRVQYMVRLRRLFARLQTSIRFDLVHQLNPVDVGMTLALFDSPVPQILGPYWPDFWLDYWEGPSDTLAFIKRMIRKAQQRRATTVLLSTPAAAVKLEVPRGGNVRVRELPPGIDTRRWVPDPSVKPGQDVLFLAGLHAYKGIFVLLDAFARLSETLPAAQLLVAGGGPAEYEIRRRIASTPSLSRVTMLGALERDDVMPVMQACAVYCLPSFGEPFGMSALEAMACGKPVVATDAGGLTYLVGEDGGRLVVPGDVQGLAEALHEILTRPNLQRRLGTHNRRIAEQLYAWPRIIDRLEGIYREALRSP